ncbi:MAG: hypothetical protein Q7K55_06740 [Candidatus Levybacteria bacterium]|nr:hypothetical protein [Candidatus Levybacteria bacterium]
MDSPYKPIESLLTTAENYYQNAGDLTSNEVLYIDNFITLVLIEAVIDKQRVLLRPGASTEYPQEKAEVERRLNELRSSISQMIDVIGKDKARDILRQVGSSITSSFVH